MRQQPGLTRRRSLLRPLRLRPLRLRPLRLRLPQLRPPRRTIRARLALFYFGVFLISGVVLLAATVGLWQGSSVVRSTAVVRVAPSSRLSPSPVSAGPQLVQHTSDLHQLLIAAAVALALLAVMSVLLGWLVAGRILQPLRAITATTREISASNLNERLNLGGPDDELKELGDTFDDLLARLERSFQFERQFVANASHELRTPLATMRASLDVAMAKPGPVPPQTVTLADRLRRELDNVEQLLESFLALAQTQRGPVTDEATVSLDDIAAAAIERRSNDISYMGLDVQQERFPQALVRGSETLLSRMVGNVVDNAVKHNQQGGWVRVQAFSDGTLVRLVVENGGPLLDQNEVNGLTRPFRRLGAERTGSERGSGLGLSIVESVVQVHDGVLDLQARPGGGLRVVIFLPLAAGSAKAAPK